MHKKATKVFDLFGGSGGLQVFDHLQAGIPIQRPTDKPR